MRRIDETLKAIALEVQTYCLMMSAACRALLFKRWYVRNMIEQLDVVGVGTLTVIMLTAFFTGAALALQSGITLDAYGARPVVGRLVSATMVKNLGPVLTGLMRCGRAGAGIAAELGSMEVTSQISALRVLGTDPIRKLVLPRILAGTLMAPVLTVIADASIACHVGLQTTGGTQGVGRSTTRAVVAGSVAVIAVDFFLTRLMISLWY